MAFLQYDVIPAKAGIQRRFAGRHWVPACAGTTPISRLRGDISRLRGDDNLFDVCEARANVLPACAGMTINQSTFARDAFTIFAYFALSLLSTCDNCSAVV